jgi:hypothetical protein
MPPYPPPNQHGEKHHKPYCYNNWLHRAANDNEAGDQPAIRNWVIAPHIGWDKGRCASSAAPVVAFPRRTQARAKGVNWATDGGPGASRCGRRWSSSPIRCVVSHRPQSADISQSFVNPSRRGSGIFDPSGGPRRSPGSSRSWRTKGQSAGTFRLTCC